MKSAEVSTVQFSSCDMNEAYLLFSRHVGAYGKLDVTICRRTPQTNAAGDGKRPIMLPSMQASNRPHCFPAPDDAQAMRGHPSLSRGSWGPVDILVAATVLAVYSVFRVPV